MIKLIVFMAAFIIFCQLPGLANEYYVDADMADDTGNGTTWATATKTISNALAKAAPTKIYVKQGVYNITEPIEMVSGCELLGGYVGSGSPGARAVEPATTTTINANGSCRVLVVSNCAAGTRIDGFAITGGVR